MKLKAFLLSILFLFPIISLQAQPGCQTQSFNPFENYYYGDVNYVVYGAAFESVNLDKSVKFKGDNLYFSISSTRLKIKVIENLKGKIKEQLIEAYIGYDCRNQIGGTAIYKPKKAFVGSSPVWVADQVSYAMDNYSEKGREEILKKVKSDLSTNNECNLFGVVVKKISDKFSYTFNDEIEIKLGYDPKSFKPMAGMKIEAKRKSDNRIFKTVTDNEGKFKFKNLAYGEYQVYSILAEDDERIGIVPNTPLNFQQRYDEVEIRKDRTNPRRIFNIEQIVNTRGK